MASNGKKLGRPPVKLEAKLLAAVYPNGTTIPVEEFTAVQAWLGEAKRLAEVTHT